MKTDKFLRNDDYYLYWQAIHDAGIKYEYSFEERYWIKQNPYMFPLDDKLKYGSIVKYRLINRLPDEPEPNTQEYLDFWDAKKKVGIILDRFGDKKLEWYKNTGMPSDFQAKFALWKINKTDKITSKDTDKAEVADSSAWTHRNLNKENKMPKVKKVKTNLEIARKKKWIGEYYSFSGQYMRKLAFKTKQEVIEMLGAPGYEGFTVDVSERKLRVKRKVDTEVVK